MSRSTLDHPTRSSVSLALGALLLALAGGVTAQTTPPPTHPASPASGATRASPGSTGASGAMGAAAPRAASSASGASAVVMRSTLERADRKFIEDAAQGGMAEVALGRVAQQRATNAQVKTFGERMAGDHGKANDELMRLASTKGVQMPSGPTRSQQRDADRLNKLSGAEFDREYMKHMVADHKKDVAAFQKASQSAKDPEVKDFASRTLPTLQSHLQMAQTTYDEVRGTKGAGMGSGMAASAASR